MQLEGAALQGDTESVGLEARPAFQPQSYLGTVFPREPQRNGLHVQAGDGCVVERDQTVTGQQPGLLRRAATKDRQHCRGAVHLFETDAHGEQLTVF